MIFRSLFIGVLTLSFCTAISQDKLPASALHPYGRYWRSGSQLELAGPAAHFGFRATGAECNLFAFTRNDHDYLQYEVDGRYKGKIVIKDSAHAPTLLKLGTPGPHTVWIYRTTESGAGALVIQKITGKGLQPLARPNAPGIEFIGNSITCGAAADTAEYPCTLGGYFDHSNSYDAYGPRVARALRANYVLSSVSGIGVYRNWNSNSPTMPEVYGNADLRDNSRRPWDFTAWQPSVVSIALGTNDLSHGDGHTPRQPFDSAAFVSAFTKFIQTVKSHYPAARIAILNSPTVGGKDGILLRNCIVAVKARVDALYPSDKPIALHFFGPMTVRGCGGHPSVEDHGLLADELVPFFRQLLQTAK
ncbi:GDSL-type esterase/lipase family protein [Puia sp. P3]|uniref:SGNH/GDSL hydrolase family protein n=1 Tax=Puia sp. P3 TaxID=3423952 RepID=UPI003D665BF6